MISPSRDPACLVFVDEMGASATTLWSSSVASDSGTVLRISVPDAYRPIVGGIRKDVTMKFVDSEAKYDALMALASEIAVEADVPPICLDVLAWNQSHA